MVHKLHKDNKGFTIIEVLIVLAIAALIMLIVFLAVPALQRNQRNNTRNSEASRAAAAASECLANRNGQTASCDTAALQAIVGTTQYLTVTVGAEAYSITGAVVTYNAQCDAAGADSVASTGGTRKFSVTYQLEPSINRCIGSE